MSKYSVWMSYYGRRDNFPARQAVCLVYTSPGKPTAIVIEVPALRGQPGLNENTYQAMGQGYFFTGMRTKTRIRFASFKGTDVAVLTLSAGDLDERIVQSLQGGNYQHQQK